MTLPSHRTRVALIMIAPAVLLIAFLYLLPLIRILALSVTEQPGALANYGQLVTSDVIGRVIWTTVRICILTTAITLAVSYVMAAALTLAAPRTRNLMFVLILLPLWLSVLIRAFAWVTVLRGNGVLNSALMSTGLIDTPFSLVRNEIGVVIGMVHYMLPFGILPLYASMRSIDARILNAARSLGAPAFTVFRRVFLPLTMPGLFSSFILIFVFSLGFYVTPAILGGGRVMMVAEYISVQVHETLEWGTATMLASVLLASVFAVIAALGRFADWESIFGKGGE
ncbi:ABC transporter permease [Falsochrobactrum sp. TDYN1]|uniref:ABC transporter permease n=1 Tax=Falsochrobactrum tianjinense TaxID=2706015 RepID=A0A949PNF9_9HYPH|nr:ABC transporter permease [Falsochrobactrum sp. TDYN1]MBV2143689.1 ABC transporter permease [Falsochrobactrum sp. TDYN1]